MKFSPTMLAGQRSVWRPIPDAWHRSVTATGKLIVGGECAFCCFFYTLISFSVHTCRFYLWSYKLLNRNANHSNFCVKTKGTSMPYLGSMIDGSMIWYDSCEKLLFADDLKFYTAINNKNYCNMLQHNIKNVQQPCLKIA